MTIPNVVLGELIDPVTFGNAVVDAVNDHETEIADRLPLSGGTLTGDLQVAGELLMGGNWNGAYLFSSGSSGREYMNVGQNANGGSMMRFYGGGDASYSGNAYIYSGGEWAVRFDKDQNTRVYGDLQVDGNINGQSVFGIALGIDTADILDRAETATMPTWDDEGVTTTDEQTDIVTVNEVVTALLAKVKQLEGRLAELEA